MALKVFGDYFYLSFKTIRGFMVTTILNLLEVSHRSTYFVMSYTNELIVHESIIYNQYCIDGQFY